MDKKVYKILSVEDNDFDFELVERKLKTIAFQYEIERVIVEEEFRDMLNQYCPDLILSDFTLPTFSGLEALKITREECPQVPFIFVSGSIGEELAVETLIQGANDYVLKDNLHKLEPAIVRALKEAKEKVLREQAEESLRKKIFELKNLIYRISHDFRGPICSIKGILNLMKDPAELNMEEVQDYVKMIDQATKQMDWVVLNLSSFQFIYNEDLQADIVNMDVFVSKLQKSVSEIEGFSAVDFEIKKTGSNIFYVDYYLLFNMCFNILHNSITFIDEQKQEHKVFCSIDVSDERLKISVEDNGVGIPTEVEPHIFDMFYRGSTQSKGAGLGLYIIKTIIDKYEGHIEIKSKENIGTKVVLTISPEKKSAKPPMPVND